MVEFYSKIVTLIGRIVLTYEWLVRFVKSELLDVRRSFALLSFPHRVLIFAVLVIAYPIAFIGLIHLWITDEEFRPWYGYAIDVEVK